MPINWTDATDVPIPAREADLWVPRLEARSYLQRQILTCLTSVDGLTLGAGAFRCSSRNEQRAVQFMMRLWELGYDLTRRPRARRNFDVWWLTGYRTATGSEADFPVP